MAVDWQVVYLLTATVAVILLGGCAIYGWRFRAHPGGGWFAAFCGAAAAWALLVALMALSTPAWAARWLALKYLFIQLTPLALLMFTLDFAAISPRWRRALLVALMVVPLATQAVVWTNDGHHAMLREVVFERSGMLTYVARIVFGPYYWVTVAQGYLLVLASLAIVWVSTVRAGVLARRRAAAIVLGILAPTIANVLLITGVFPRVADPMPIGLVVSAALLWWSALSQHIFELLPVARNAMVDATGDGMLAVDAKGRVVDANAAMRSILAMASPGLIGQSARAALTAAPALARHLFGEGDNGVPRDRAGGDMAEVSIGERAFEVRVAALAAPGAWLLLLHDSTERRRMERQREGLIAELQQAVAKVRTLEGLLPMCASCKKVRTADDHWLPVDEYLRDQAGAVVSHGICPGCSGRLYPRTYASG